MPGLPMLEKFVRDLRAIWAAQPDNQSRMQAARPLLERLLADPELKAHSAQWPSTEGRKNLLLYVDPDYHFAINAVVRAPGRVGSVHDHADAWVLYGILDGSKQLQFFGADYEDTPTPALRGDDNVIEDVPYRDRSGRYRENPGEDVGTPARYR